MSVEEMVLQKLRALPPDKQKEVLEFVDSLKPGGLASKTLHNLEGFLQDLDADVTEKDITEARREMWGNFPRDIS